jgi:NADH-quinone oxidoreductase subunit A
VTQFFNSHSLAIYIVFVTALLCIVVALSSVLGPRRVGAARGRSMSIPYESGILPSGSSRIRLPVQYYLIAMFFVIFDVEGVFLFSWSTVAVRAGWAAYATVLVFIAFLGVALAYLWRSGALEWGLRRRPAGARDPSRPLPGHVLPGQAFSEGARAP